MSQPRQQLGIDVAIKAMVTILFITATYLSWQMVMTNIGQEPPLRASDVRTLDIGESLPDLEVADTQGRLHRLSSIVGSPCHILVVFDSACPFSARLGAETRGMTTARDVPVTWISVPDQAANVAAFIEGNGIVVNTYVARRWRDIGAMGVVGSPSILLVDSDLRYWGAVNLSTDGSFPVECDRR